MNFDGVDATHVAQAEMEPGIMGGLIAAAAETLGNLAAVRQP